jgi:hypothetical protein
MPATLDEVRQLVTDAFQGADVGGIEEDPERHRISGTIVWPGFRDMEIEQRDHLVLRKVRDRLGLRGRNVDLLFPLAPGERL